MARKRQITPETAETLAGKQRDISVSEFFLKNRHLLGFDNPRKALLTTVKEAVDNALDACEEAGIVPEIAVDIRQTGDTRYRVSVTDNGPGIVRRQIPHIFAKLLYGSKFHRLRMSRGQQGIGISAAGMYGQLTTGNATHILSKTARGKAHEIQVQIDTRKNTPAILRDEAVDWKPSFPKHQPPAKARRRGRAAAARVTVSHGTCVSIELEAAYVRGRLSVDEYLKQCAIVNPHLQMHYRIIPLSKGAESAPSGGDKDAETAPAPGNAPPWTSFPRVNQHLPDAPREIKPHPHGVELGLLMQMLKDSDARTLRAVLQQDFSRVSANTALAVCERAGLNPRARPSRIAARESEALYKALNETKLMRPPTDCLSPIGEAQILAGLKKEIQAEFYT
ncbi:MAG: ATP-binding protein, partial [Lentisphaerae bacterium]|nr:ATP-binding protein [Lentisphaerota bacterium]